MSASIHREWVQMELGDMGKSIFNDLPLSEDRAELKKSSIETALAFEDYQLLTSLIKTREGLLTVELRRKIWPILMGIKDINAINHVNLETNRQVDYKTLPKHKDEDQLKLDVDRSFVFYPREKSDFEISILREKLMILVTKILRFNPLLNYYQGYHDIASIFLLVFKDENQSFNALEFFTLFSLRDFMLPTIDSSVDHLRLIPDLLSKIDYKFSKLIDSLDPFYSLSSIITLYAHNFTRFQDVCLLWDFIMVENSIVVSVYFYSSVLIYYKEQILDDLMELSGCSDEKDLISEKFLMNNKDIIHSILSGVVSKNLNRENCQSQFFEILQLTLGYLNKFPPSKLNTFNNDISSNSVLKTSSIYVPNLSFEQIESKTKFYTYPFLKKLFKEQVKENQQKQADEKLMKSFSGPSMPSQRLYFLSKFLSSSYHQKGTNRNSKSIKVRNKNFQLSTFIFRLSFTIGIGIILKYYFDQHEINFSSNDNFFVIGFQSMNKALRNNGFNLTGFSLLDVKNCVYRFIK
ncbi:hypothetical protein PACTADRAFT_34347 [Pachysolen tannophilus NRRL Y-2460]|uniref:Rab-GAP TBC domain-containing protein n=1 Tax=Pachysolen tannophilus NRRL Y-2460 TaxID=669874 RepID=A0A1E4TS94_PACTA|nr:hypothetical protein PACTADRAFT_34347 [Pachysolen tannophilus NRRL Y-2460]